MEYARSREYRFGEVEQDTLYEGAWQPGQEYRYKFELASASWPPTYYGNYLNVGHYIEAKAKLSWATDAKATLEFPVVATAVPANLEPTVAKTGNSKLGWLIGGPILLLFLFAFSPFILIVGPIVAIVLAFVWFFFSFLPSRVTGPVVCELAQPSVVAGQTVRANLEFTPRSNSTINGVLWTLTAFEECISGSGSNRKTHKNILINHKIQAAEMTQLQVGKRVQYPFEFTIPAGSPPSLKFGNNHIKWDLEARIDIPRWPDWSRHLSLVVAPSNSVVAVPGQSPDAALPPIITATPPKTLGDENWFKEVLKQIRATQHDAEQMEMVIAAVNEFEFAIQATIEEDIDTPEIEDEDQFERLDDYEWWTAFCPQHNLSAAIAWRETPMGVQQGSMWSGFASIVGFDSSSQRVLMEATR